MSMKSILLMLAYLSFSAVAIEFKVFHEGDRFYVQLINMTNEPIDIARDFIFDDCANRANICVEVYEVDGLGLHILSMPMSYDHEFSQRYELWPRRSYGRVFLYNDIKKRFAIEPGDYIVIFKYRDWKREKFYQSDPIHVAF
ncbi:hypothetical protein Q3O59_09555 [Alkalimonas delamerensis]|uniref:DUF4430 domain-containing protein n=1 Tax=Alkalimonas delamerensis TaxID=265981 RepID=A0ABT9GQM4_9GAMM|nr:hypothetical protein [Alkalimonas delamerensis]MDP4529277.1 hypothetical protein [Alkalimonas delamerensis]